MLIMDLSSTTPAISSSLSSTTTTTTTTTDYRTKYYIVTPEDLANQRRLSEQGLTTIDNTFIPSWRASDDFKERGLFLEKETSTRTLNQAIKMLSNSPPARVRAKSTTALSNNSSTAVAAKAATCEILNYSPIKKVSKRKSTKTTIPVPIPTSSDTTGATTNGLYSTTRRHSSHHNVPRLARKNVSGSSNSSNGSSIQNGMNSPKKSPGRSIRRGSIMNSTKSLPLDNSTTTTGTTTTTSTSNGGGGGGSKHKKNHSKLPLKEGTSSADCPLYQFLNVNPKSDTIDIDEDQFIEIVQANPDACSMVYRFDSFHNDLLYPLHMACCLGISLHAIKKCYKAYPDAIEYIPDASGMNCLHYACMYTRAPLKVVNFLLKYDFVSSSSSSSVTSTPPSSTPPSPTTTNGKHNNGSSHSNNSSNSGSSATVSMGEMKCKVYQRTPLHYACMCSPTMDSFNSEVILLLTQTKPDTVMYVDKDGYTPLHLACSVDQPCLAIVEDLTTVNPNVCYVQTKRSLSTPLHIACTNTDIIDPDSEIMDVIKELVHVGVDALHMKDKKGSLPIFIAISNHACYKLCKLFAKKYPDSLIQTNKRGQTPFRLAKYMKASKVIIEYLYPYEEPESEDEDDDDDDNHKEDDHDGTYHNDDHDESTSHHQSFHDA